MIGKIVTVTVDRPICSFHPSHPKLQYPVNYGYIKGIFAPDGEEQNAYLLGISFPVWQFTGKVIAIIHRKDDNEDKWVVAPEDMTFTKEEIAAQTAFQEQYFDTTIEM